MSRGCAPRAHGIACHLLPVDSVVGACAGWFRRNSSDPRTAAGYAASSVLPYSWDLKGKLLVMHGMADDNVLFLHGTDYSAGHRTWANPLRSWFTPARDTD